MRALTRLATAIATLLAVAVVVSPGARAASGVRADEVAAVICRDVANRLGLQRFRQRFRSPEVCAAEVASAAAVAIAACTDDPDPDACLDGRVRALVDQYSGEPTVSGGVYTTRAGAHVRVTSVDTSGVTDVQRLAWAEFLDSLPHSGELVSVTLQLALPPDVRRACGPSALACYLPTTRTILAAPSDIEGAPGARSLVAHEYGHHIANSRLNLPWPALDYGTKRWATHMRICERVRSRELTTNALWGPAYRLMPGEGFAEAYRVLSEQRIAAAEAPWLLVDERFYPNADALRLLEKDVLEPWGGPTKLTFTGRGSRTLRVATPLDGPFKVTMTSAAGTAYVVSAPTLVCGRRSTAVRVTRIRGKGAFRLAVSRP